MNQIVRLHEAVAAVAPIYGIGVGRPDDNRTWRIDFRREASKTQRAAAQAALAEFDWYAIPAERRPETIDARIAALEAENTKLRDALISKGVLSEDDLDLAAVLK